MDRLVVEGCSISCEVNPMHKNLQQSFHMLLPFVYVIYSSP